MNKNYLDIFKEYCTNKGLRYTSQRDIIIKEIYKIEGHFDVDKLYICICNRFLDTKLSKVSIYRNILHLIEAGLIRESLNEKNLICYEHTLGHEHHDHMKCLKCGKVFEFFEPEIDKLQKSLCEKRGFNMTSHIHVIKGYCLKCQKK
jgi:Fur family ferric uptake transcriptional regulator